MSLGVTQSSTPPFVTRPQPPNRPTSRSYAASPRTAAGTPSARSVREEAADPPSERKVGVLGGLRERTEDELGRASREALEEALREEWDLRHLLMSRLEEGEDRQKMLEERTEALERDLRSMHSRAKEAFVEQSRLEADLEGREELLDHLRARATEADKQAREAQQRASEQTKAFDAERQALHAQELHLRSRLQSISTSHLSQRARSSGTGRLEEELATLTFSHSTLLAQLNTLAQEVHKLKSENLRLQEENEGWEFLVRERTFTGKVREGGLLGREVNQDDHSETSGSREKQDFSQLEALDEELEMDELRSDLDAQSPIFEEDHGFARNLDGRGLSASPEDALLAPPESRWKSKSKDVPATGSGTTLAAELGRAEADSDTGNVGEPGEGGTAETLRTEIKNLREANKALTLYCSKIIDRIIAQEGFEHILSVDYKTRRTGTRSASGSSVTRGTQSLRDISASMQAKENGHQLAESASQAAERGAKKTRPLSMMVRAMSGQVEKVEIAKQESRPIPVKPDMKAEKRAKRGFSLDFRSLGFGPSPSPESPKPVLKNLTLSTRSSPTIPPPTSSAQARKLEPQEEDEEDRRERHRLEAALKLMGIERPSPSTEESPVAFAPSSAYWTGQKLAESPPASVHSTNSRSSRANTIVAESRKPGTSLSRLSSAFGRDHPPPSHLEGLLIPKSTEAAYRTCDGKEAEKANAPSLGRGRAEYTSLNPESIRRSSGHRRTSSGQGGQAEKREQAETVEQVEKGRQKMMGKSESISTLWSMGSSRPASRELDAELLGGVDKKAGYGE